MKLKYAMWCTNFTRDNTLYRIKCPCNVYMSIKRRENSLPFPAPT